MAFVAFVLADVALRVALRRRLDVRLTPPVLLRVDLRDGFPVAESSSFAPPFFAARFETFRVPLWPSPALRSEALTPGSDVSTGSSRRGRGALLGFGGLASFSCCALKRSAFVDMSVRYSNRRAIEK
ncbi:MAG: hypothetical protein IT374_04660 [Polyangiaceae bacterium]|uniref:Uncharacterized protein n=1 Tax=Archangium gephyra TaxID=48 RepID=A0A2W5SPD4_9BACT|nr:hypothetical protein [Polyangiaceae bacterium]PZR03597.1 MAG: hypothetical protein DI536_35745 [Archangium gephyra]